MGVAGLPLGSPHQATPVGPIPTTSTFSTVIGWKPTIAFLAAPNRPARQERRCAMWQIARRLA
jgi:hypothetical protein